MSSNIDATKPAEGNAYTVDMRANFAAAKAEIEGLQAFFNNAPEINLLNYLTAGEIADVRAGVLSFDAATAIQAAINSATTLSVVTTARNAVVLRIPAGKYDIRTQLDVKARVDIASDGVLYNSLVSTTDFIAIFKSGSHCTKLTVDANGKSGVCFGELAAQPDMRIQNVRVLNVGAAVNQVGVRTLGSKLHIDTINVDGGRPGIDIGDGGTNTCTNLTARMLRSYNAYTGIRIDKAEFIDVAQLIVDSATQNGLVIDRSRELYLPETSIFFTDAAPGTVFASGYAFDIGFNSIVDNCNGLTLDAMVTNTGGKIGRISYTDKCNFKIFGHKGLLYSGSTHNITGGVEYAVGNGTEGFADIYLPTGINNTGTASFFEVVSKPKVTGITLNGPIGASSFATPTSGVYLGQRDNGLAGDLNINNGTTGVALTNVAGLALAIAANEQWVYEVVMSIGAALATTGAKFAVTIPALATMEVDCGLTPDLITAANRMSRRATASGAALDFTAATEAGVGDGIARMFIRVTNGANAGVVQVQAAQSTASATNLTIRALSTIQGKRVL